MGAGKYCSSIGFKYLETYTDALLFTLLFAGSLLNYVGWLKENYGNEHAI